jgi:hypothetical protein
MKMVFKVYILHYLQFFFCEMSRTMVSGLYDIPQ